MPAQQVSNPGTNGSNARYYIGDLPQENGVYVDDAGWHYDSNGLSLDRPDSYVNGLPPANSSEAYSVYGAQPPGGGGGSGGGFGGDLTASPYYQQYKAQIDAANASDLAGVKQGIQQALIQFGLVPEGFQDKYGALDDTIRQLIQQNTDTGVSMYARLMQGRDDAKRQAISNLAARGLSRSGAKGFNLRRGTLDFNRALSDALNSVTGNINQLTSGYATRQQDRLSGLASLLAQIASSYRPDYYNPPGTPTPPSIQPQPQPSYSVPVAAEQHLGIGVPNENGYAVQTGGGYYTNPQTGDLTSKWQKLAGL